MKTWLVACSKGGVGKTTLATHLAAQSALAGQRTVLVDADPQASATRWCERRAGLDSAVLPLDGRTKAWAKRIPASTQQVLVDTPAGATGRDLEAFLDAADAVLIPVQPSALDIEATAHFLETLLHHPRLRKGALPAALVLNRSKPNTNASQQALALLRDWPLPVVAQLRDSQAYVVLTGLGKSLFDYHSAQVREHQQDWEPLRRWLHKH